MGRYFQRQQLSTYGPSEWVHAELDTHTNKKFQALSTNGYAAFLPSGSQTPRSCHDESYHMQILNSGCSLHQKSKTKFYLIWQRKQLWQGRHISALNLFPLIGILLFFQTLLASIDRNYPSVLANQVDTSAFFLSPSRVAFLAISSFVIALVFVSFCQCSKVLLQRKPSNQFLHYFYIFELIANKCICQVVSIIKKKNTKFKAYSSSPSFCSWSLPPLLKTLFLLLLISPYVLTVQSPPGTSHSAQGINAKRNETYNSTLVDSNTSKNSDSTFNATLKVDNNGSSSHQDINCKTHIADFDIRMFDELGMSETILVNNLLERKPASELTRLLNMNFETKGVYESCFKNHISYVNLNNLKRDWNKDNPASKCDQQFLASHPDKKFNYVLHQLFHSKEIMPPSIHDRIALVCDLEQTQPQSSLNVFDKLYLLATYEHRLCGSIFKNSMRSEHLLKDVLNLKSSRNRRGKSAPKSKRDLLPNNNKSPAPNSFLDFYFTNNTSSPPLASVFIDQHVQNNNPIYPDQSITEHFSNCTLLLLNTYLLAYKTECDNQYFVESINHYDCTSNNFSVKSNCELCQEAYKIWLCTSNIPYYANGELLRPCQRYCFNVQNMCPFMRPVDDSFGGQPVFNCRNVIQTTEDKIDGFEDDDENYYDDDLLDDDKCYHSCHSSFGNTKFTNTTIDGDLEKVFRNELSSLDASVMSDKQKAPFSMSLFSSETTKFSLVDAWSIVKSNVSRTLLTSSSFLLFSPLNGKSNTNYYQGSRFTPIAECVFNLPSTSAAAYSMLPDDFLKYRLLICSSLLYMFIQRILN